MLSRIFRYRCYEVAFPRSVMTLAMGIAILSAGPSLGQHAVSNSQKFAGWQSQRLSPLFIAEGGSAADLDADGQMDLIAGPWVYFGPDYATKIELYPSKPYNINGYSEHFFTFTHDLDRDGDVDILIQGFPGAAAHWYRNPGAGASRTGAWERFSVMDVVDNESPAFRDITDDGVPELVCITGGQYGYAAIPNDPTQKWSFHPISEKKADYQRFTHGLGVGDVNDDGRTDLIAKDGWWEHPATLSDALWTFHPYEFSGPGSAQMFAVDLDGDSRTEIITSLSAHGYGLAVYKKSNVAGDPWIRIDLMTDKAESFPTKPAISQLHAVEMADMDGDGVLDILTGKRFWAHNGHDVGENETPYLVWFKAMPTPSVLRFQANVIDDDSGVGTQITARDVNGDGRTDVFSVSKRGIHLLTQARYEAPNTGSFAEPLDGFTDVIPIRDALGGFRPARTAEKPLNFDFESGDLRDWEAEGAAFFNQPVQGDTIALRLKDTQSRHQGDYWIGSSEVCTDVGLGSLTSKPFVIKHPWISFLISGGSGPETRVELVDLENSKVLHQFHGSNSDAMKRVVLPAGAMVGKGIQIRLIDNSRESWGHINFDDFRTHEVEPKIPDQERHVVP